MSAAMNEAQYTARVNKKVKCYCWKVSTTLQRGKLDCFYAWGNNHLWIEYKYNSSPINTINLSRPPYLSKIQQYEIKQLLKTQQQVLIIVGTPNGGIIFTPQDIPLIHHIDQLTLLPDDTIVDMIHSRMNFLT